MHPLIVELNRLGLQLDDLAIKIAATAELEHEISFGPSLSIAQSAVERMEDALYRYDRLDQRSAAEDLQWAQVIAGHMGTDG